MLNKPAISLDVVSNLQPPNFGGFFIHDEKRRQRNEKTVFISRCFEHVCWRTSVCRLLFYGQ